MEKESLVGHWAKRSTMEIDSLVKKFHSDDAEDKR